MVYLTSLTDKENGGQGRQRGHRGVEADHRCQDEAKK